MVHVHQMRTDVESGYIDIRRSWKERNKGIEAVDNLELKRYVMLLQPAVSFLLV